MLCTSGSMDQFHACGLKTVKHQMKMRKLLSNTHAWPSSSPSAGSSSGNVTVVPESPPASRKLTKQELVQLTPEEKRVYLMMCVYIQLMIAMHCIFTQEEQSSRSC